MNDTSIATGSPFRVSGLPGLRRLSGRRPATGAARHYLRSATRHCLRDYGAIRHYIRSTTRQGWWRGPGGAPAERKTIASTAWQDRHDAARQDSRCAARHHDGRPEGIAYIWCLAAPCRVSGHNSAGRLGDKQKPTIAIRTRCLLTQAA